MGPVRVVICLFRRDLRFSDNPALHDLARTFQQSQRPYTHLLPLYVFPAQQIEVSGFVTPRTNRSPFPEARSEVLGFWRCGPHRARFLAECVWDLKMSMEKAGSGLDIRVGTLAQVVKDTLRHLQAAQAEVIEVWMTSEEGSEEKKEEKEVRQAAEDTGTAFRLLNDEKYFIDDRDLPFEKATQLPDVFTSFKKQVEPLRDAPRKTLPAPSELPPMPPDRPDQSAPFSIPSSLSELIEALQRPLLSNTGIKTPPAWPRDAKSAHPFRGGERNAHDRVRHLISSGSMTTYKDTRNGMLGTDFSTKLSAWLALGCITARQIHQYLLEFEEGRTELGKGAKGFAKGENKGTAAVRFELLWRDYFRLATRKFASSLFHISGFKNNTGVSWRTPHKDPETGRKIMRWLEGRTGNGFIDASMRELFLTGYTSNRLRQNVASFLSKHLGIDWRVGAEWYECMLVDYDVSSNWGNWQYTAGVGNDPRESRMFNPVKQAFDYDGNGDYVKTWVEELQAVTNVQEVFQPWKMGDETKKLHDLAGNELVEAPLKRIEFHPGRGGKAGRKPQARGRRAGQARG